MSEKSSKAQFYFDVLNNSPGQFRVAARRISSDDEALKVVRNGLEINTPGLAMHLGSWITLIQSYAVPLGPIVTERAINGFEKGALMTFDVLDQVAKRNDQQINNPRFDPSDFIDIEFTKPEDEHTLLAGSMRGRYLPERFPAMFKSVMTMLGVMYHQPPGMIEQRVYGGRRDMEDVFIAHFITGSAETVLPLERYAQADYLDHQLQAE